MTVLLLLGALALGPPPPVPAADAPRPTGLAVVRPLPLPTRTVRNKAGVEIRVERVDHTPDGTFFLNLAVVSWVDRPEGLAVAPGLIRRQFEMDESISDVNEQARWFLGHVFLLEAPLNPDGGINGSGAIHDLGTGDPEAAARVELDGFRTVRELRHGLGRADDPALVRRAAADATIPSLVLVMEADRLARPDLDDRGRRVRNEALLDLMLRPSTPPAIAVHAGMALETSSPGPAGRERCRLVVGRLSDEVHRLAPVAGREVGRLDLVFIKLLSVLGSYPPAWLVAMFDRGRLLPDLDTCRDRIRPAAGRTRDIALAHIEALRKLLDSPPATP